MGPRQRKRPRPMQWLWLLLWVLLLGGSANLCLWAVAWLTQIPPVPDCAKISPTSVWRDRLYCAKVLVKAGSEADLAKAIALTADWPKPNSSYEEAESFLTTASEKLLFLANGEAQEGRLEEAVALASEIPLDTPLRQSAQGLIYSWRKEWESGTALEQQIQKTIELRQWEQARQHLQQLQTLKLDYWLRDRHGHWQQQLQQEQNAWVQLQQARELAADATPEGLQQGLTLARQIALGSHAWEQAKAEVDSWSQQLVSYALNQWQQGSLAEAIATAQMLPPSPNYAPEVQDLIQFSHAQKLAEKAAPQAPQYTPNYGDLFALVEAIRAAQKIASDSPFYPEAQAFIEDWQAQLQDLIRLQSAHMLATIGQEGAYRLAIDQAAQVTPERPRRLQGQTLVAHWQNQIQRIQDRPILRAADRLAQPGTIPALQTAIAKASEVELGRALRIEAQTRIAAWQQEIQVIEDRPILNEANALASEDQLQQAIQVARRIQPGRALYDRAQDLINGWTAQIQIAEDKPILDEAKDLAYIGSLTRAINLASQIAPGRALYDEAQNAIAIWKAEREYIWSIREAEANGSGSGNSGAGAEDSSDSQ